jgi:uncharacterized protein (DUF952 family)/flavin reductase (DIM6/NTAB) family NADH-FMN oxidoreductase RutF
MRIFHIVKKEDWVKSSQLIYQGESLKTQGFIHCCTADQIDKVLEQWFKGQTDLVLVEINPDLVKANLKFENLEGGQELFPHIYGPINLDAVINEKIIANSEKPKIEPRIQIPIEKFTARSHSIFDLQWFLLSCGDFEKQDFNSMTISWGALGTMWSMPVALVAVRFTRYTFQFMEKFDTFTLNAFSEKYRDLLNEFGSRSGREINKVQPSKITAIASQQVKAPSYLEAELAIECKKIYWNDINPAHFLDDRIVDKYLKRDYHRFYIGEVLGIFGTPNYLSKSL